MRGKEVDKIKQPLDFYKVVKINELYDLFGDV